MLLRELKPENTIGQSIILIFFNYSFLESTWKLINGCSLICPIHDDNHIHTNLLLYPRKKNAGRKIRGIKLRGKKGFKKMFKTFIGFLRPRKRNSKIHICKSYNRKA